MTVVRSSDPAAPGVARALVMTVDDSHRPDGLASIVDSPGGKRPGWLSAELDIVTPTPARVVNALLGGCHNFKVDRDFADRVVQVWPGFHLLAGAQLAFTHRAVRWLTAQGIRQFLDIGCGLPVIGGVHHVAPTARVVYADLDPVVVACVERMSGDHPSMAVVEGDLRSPRSILYHDDVLERLDFGAPVGVVLSGVLAHLTDDDNPGDCLAQIREAVVPGSYVALSHLAGTPGRGREQEQLVRLYDHTPVPLRFRTRQQIADLLGGWELVEPGLVSGTDWRPEPYPTGLPAQPNLLTAVARAV